jgi:hypothetical protein
MNNGPNLPRSLACGEQVILDLVTNGGEGIPVNKSEVGEEDTHEDWAPEELINGNLSEDWGGISSGDFIVEPVVEVMSRGAMVDESEERKGRKTLVIDGSSSNEDLKIREKRHARDGDEDEVKLKTGMFTSITVI